MRPDRFLLVAGFLCGLGFVAITPPFQTPDEPAHFSRAYWLSEGHVSAERTDVQSGAPLPHGIRRITADLRGSLPENPHLKFDPLTIAEASRVPLGEGDRRFVDFRNVSVYGFVAYLPQSFGIAAARTAGGSPLVMFYTARISTLIATTLLIWLAIGILPSYRWLATALAMTPMALFVRASLSADAMTMALAFLFVALVARLAWNESIVATWRDVAMISIAGAALSLTKPAYIALAFLPLLIPSARFSKVPRASAVSIVLAAALVAFAYTSSLSAGAGLPFRNDVAVNRDAQIAAAVAEPLRVAGIFARDYLVMGRRYVAQMVGQLGWLDVNLPKPLLLAYGVLIGFLMIVDTRERVAVTRGQRLGLVAITTVTLCIIAASQYALWTGFRAPYLDGLQGRYFIPLAPAAMWIFHRRSDAMEPARVTAIVPWAIVVTFGISLWLVASRYYA